MMAQPPSPALSWNTHCLLTRAALGAVPQEDLDQETSVTALKDFLSGASAEMAPMLSQYWARVAAKTGKANAMALSLVRIHTARDFSYALGLNPDVAFHYVRTLGPEEMPGDSVHNQSREGPAGNSYVHTPFGQRLSAREVLAVFSDEPDWGMDQDLFSIQEYGYGPAPLGFSKGGSSQAPFHMAFFHEGPVLKVIVRRLVTSFLEERVRIFFALARLAFAKKHDYWGWRFTAWAMHYLQDLTQPYHARALPAPVVPAVIRSFIKPGFRRVALLNRDYLRNRHLVFEAAVHLMLNQAAKEGGPHAFLHALSSRRETLDTDLSTLLRESSRVPAKIARSIDRVTVTLLNDNHLEDTRHSLANDPAYRIDLAFVRAAAQRPDVLEQFVELVSVCLEETGRVTRYAVDPRINRGRITGKP